MGDNKLQSCREEEEDPPHPVSVSVSLTCRCSCQHRRLGNLFGFCDEMVSGDNKLPDICQSLGRERRDKRREAKRRERLFWLFSRRSLEKLPTDFPLYLIFLLCSAGLFVHTVSESSRVESREQRPQLPHFLQLLQL